MILSTTHGRIGILSTLHHCSKREVFCCVYKHDYQTLRGICRWQSAKTGPASGSSVTKHPRTEEPQVGHGRHLLTNTFSAWVACKGGSGIISMCLLRSSDFRHMRREPFQRVGFHLNTSDGQLHSCQNKLIRSSMDGRSHGLGYGVLNVDDEEALDKAVEGLFQMDLTGIVPSMRMYFALLKACGKRKALPQAKRVHAHLAKHGMEYDKYLGELLVNTLVKCNSFEQALQVFHKLSYRTCSMSWTAVISGYVNAGQHREALGMYQKMQQEGVRPDKHTFVSLLKACGSIANLEEGQRIHAEAVKYRYDFDLVVATSLVHMYSKCGRIMHARHVFDSLSERDVVLWNAMLAGYAQQGQAEKALQLYKQMLEQGVGPNDRTFVSLLQACGSLAEQDPNVFVDAESLIAVSLQTGKVVHAEAQRGGYELDAFVGNALISMYGKCGSVVDAQVVYDRLSQRDVVSCTAMLMACVQQGYAEKALHLYAHMLQDSICQNDRTFVFALQACGSLAEKEESNILGEHWLKVDSLQKGRVVHAEVQRRGYRSDIFVSGTLLGMYGKCGSTQDAQNVFDGLSRRDVVLWNAMLAAYAQQGQADKTLQLYVTMLEEGASPDDRTFVSTLQACSMLTEKDEHAISDGLVTNFESLQKGKALHAGAWKRGYQSDLFVRNALISMYGKAGNVMDAQLIFNGLSNADLVSWNAMLMVYTMQGQGDKTLQLYGQMLAEGMVPDDTTYLCVLQACGDTGATDLCIQIHRHLLSADNIMSHNVANTLISGYGKFGRMEDAQEVFDTLPQPDVVSWTALLAGYARQGNIAASLQCYEDMRLAGVKPSGLTFLSLISACSHAGMVDKGVEYFESMNKDYGIAPEVAHYVTMVDLLGRAGHFTLVENLLSGMLVPPNRSLWMCLLNACRKHCNVVLGKRAFDSVVAFLPKYASPYAVMSHIYSQAGLQDSARMVDELRQKAGARKMAGQSWIEHEKGVRTLMAGECEQELPHVHELLGHIRRTL